MKQPTEQISEAADNRKSGSKSASGKRKNKSLIFILMLFAVMIFLSRNEPVNTVDCTPDILAAKPDVIMLGAWWCTYCYQAKKYFQHNNINYCEYDMENTAIGKQLYEKHGGGAIPILLIGKYQLSGFNENQIEQALSQLKENI